MCLFLIIEELAAYVAEHRQELQEYHTFLDASTKGFLDQFLALSSLPPQVHEEKEEFKQGQKAGLYLDSTTLYPLELMQCLPGLAHGLNAIHEELKTLKIKAGERQ